jgi:hypothetical protein
MSNLVIDEDTDLLAAEFVLGTLDSEERANAQSQLRMDHGFIAMVRIWERRFCELHLMVEPVEPDAKILQRIKAKIAEIAPSEPAPDGKPPVEVTPGPPPPEAEGAAASTEMPKPVDVVTGGETPKPQDVPVVGTMPKPQDVPVIAVSATGETEKLPPAGDLVMPISAEGQAAADVPTAAEAQPSPESRPLESAERFEPGPAAEIAIPTPPPLPPPPLKVPDKFQENRPGGRPEITIDVIRRSRGRWRAFGVCMTLLIMGLGALLADWRLVHARVPDRLRPVELMMSIGIETIPKPAPVVKRAPPESQFDE